MFKFLSKFDLSFFMLAFSTLFAPITALESAGMGQCKVHSDGTVVMTWQEVDETNNSIIRGAIGDVSTEPSTWTVSTLSSGISSTFNNTPHLFSNAEGDVVVLWQFVDENNSLFRVAAAVLESGTSSWNSQAVSETSENAGFFDETASIDEAGNIVVLWTSSDITTNVVQLRGANAVVGPTPTWEVDLIAP